LSTNWLLAKTAGVYVELLRNVPLIVQLFFLVCPHHREFARAGGRVATAPGFFSQ
jgi:ABC-type amino acid transport system permease subunit